MVFTMKIDKTYQVKNSLHEKQKDSPYDILRLHCKSCKSIMDIRVYHSFGKFEYYKINNLPNKISKYNVDSRNDECDKCKKLHLLEKQADNPSKIYKII